MEEKIFNIFKIQVLTPVHIGSGEEKLKKNLDYIVDKNKTYFIDWDILLQDKKIQNEITDALLSNNTTIIKELARKLNAFKSIINSPVSSNEISKNIKNKFTQNPIIPGSSIKGSIRSVLLEYLLKNEKNKKDSANDLNSIFGNPAEGKNFMRFFQITDAEFNLIDYIEAKIFNLTKSGNDFNGGWKHGSIGTNKSFQPTGFVFSYEIIPINALGLLNIGINHSAFKRVFNNGNKGNFKRKSDIINGGFKTLFEIINKHSENLIDKEIKFHKKYNNAQYSEKLVDSWNNILREVSSAIQNNNMCCILRVGQGSGFHSITGDWIFETHHYINQIMTSPKNRGAYNNELSAKSRRFAFIRNDNDYIFYPFGFIKITLLSDDDYNRIKKDLESSKEKISVPGKTETGKTPVTEREHKAEAPVREFTPPKHYSGKIEQGKTIVPAIIIESGVPNRVKLLIENNESELPLTGYKSPIEKGKYICVRISQYSKGLIKQVNYHSDYKP